MQVSVEEKHEALKAAVTDPETNRLSDRALAQHLDVSQFFVSKHRTRYAPRPETRIARNGSVHRSRARRQRTSRPVDKPGKELVPASEWRELFDELRQAKARITELEQAVVDAADAVRAEVSEQLHELGKLRDQVGRYQSDLAKRRRRTEHYVAQLCQKLMWLGWEPDEAVLAISDGVLACPAVTVQLTPREQDMFRDMYTELEGEVSRHYHNRWMREGRTKAAQAEGRLAGKTGGELDEFVALRRDEWINEQIELDPWPWDDR